MKSRYIIGVWISAFALIALSWPVFAFGAVDQYVGDTAIYGSVNSQNLKPNVLFVIDNSRGMDATTSTSVYYDANNDGQPDYLADPSAPLPTYTGSYPTDDIYKVVSLGHYTDMNKPTLADVQAHCPTAYHDLYYYGSTLTYLDTNGYCDDSKSAETYVLGNYLNFQQSSPTSTTTAIDQVQQAVLYAAKEAKNYVRVGLMTFGPSNKGGNIVYPVQDISSLTFDGTSNFETSLAAITNPANLLGSNTQPAAEALWDGGTYLGGRYGTSDRIATLSNSAPETSPSPWPTPIQYNCQPNIIVLITMGNDPTVSTDTVTESPDLSNGNVADVAQWLYSHNLETKAAIPAGTAMNSVPDANVDVVQAFYTQTDLLKTAATDGAGSYYNVQNQAGLKEALLNCIANVVNEANTSFVAPVVPTSPENRTYSGDRIYLGLFQPQTQSVWYGNLKKYGINSSNQIVDAFGNQAIYQPPSPFAGQFIQSTLSYWYDTGCTDASICGDGGLVTQGGVGGVLLARDFVPSDPTQPMHDAPDPRHIYTYIPGVSTTKDLTASSNRFDTDNTNLAWDSVLDLSSSSDKTPMIKYVYGLDAYDDDPYERQVSPTHTNDGITQEKRRWVLGDILHSKPVVVNYNSYGSNYEGTCDDSAWSTTDASNHNYNKSVIYVGANDGMLHAFRDCDGRELWGFIPPAVLPNLKYYHGTKHTPFVDGSPTVYKYDANGDGYIDPSAGDKVILLFGLRRGGSAYYALDVTDPLHPKYLWSIDSLTAASGILGHHSDEPLGESWSQPELAKVKVGTQPEEVAFVGMGYDNNNEDSRFGDTQKFTNAGVTDPPASDRGYVTSGGSTSASGLTSPKGRGIFAFEVASLDSATGAPTIATQPYCVWEYTPDTTNAINGADSYNRSNYLKYSVPSDITVLDTDYDGYADRLYFGDTGGQLWRISQHSDSSPYAPTANPNILTWDGKVIFSANPGSENTDSTPSTQTNGRKIFYRPSVTIESPHDIGVYFGTGDRAHPLNTAVTDRMYALFDRDQHTTMDINESNMVNLTNDYLQATGTTPTGFSATQTLSDLSSSSNYGWDIRLDQNAGEKVLAPALVFNKVAYYTTYAPLGTGVVDPCTPGDLGQSRLYAVNYLNGEAVFNFDTNNDSITTTNTRASVGGNILDRDDRSEAMGVGIPSGLVMTINSSGDVQVLIGCGGGICSGQANPGGTILPIYWLPW